MLRRPVLPTVMSIFLVLACEPTAPTQVVSEDDGWRQPSLMTAAQRPITDFVDPQGTFCFPDGVGGCLLFVPPVENYLGWADLEQNICASYDYAGLADEWITAASGGSISFGTTFSGSLTESLLEDGRAQVHVRLHTKNALTFAIDGCDFATDPVIFGDRPLDILGGVDAALGDGFLHLMFINSALGAPLPDLIQLAFAPAAGQELVMLSTYFRAAGTVPDGASAQLTATQTGLFFTSFMGATGDGFPVENIDLRVFDGTN